MPFGTRVRTNYDCGVTEEILDYVKEIASSTSSETNISAIIESLTRIVNLLGNTGGEGGTLTMYDIVNKISGDTSNISSAITDGGDLYERVESIDTHAGNMDTAVNSILKSMTSTDAAKKNDCMYMYGGASIGIRSYVGGSSASSYYLPQTLSYSAQNLTKSVTLSRIASIVMLNSDSNFVFPTASDSVSNAYLIARVPNEIGLISTCADVVPVAISIVQDGNGNNVLVSGTVYGYVSAHDENGGYTITIPAGPYYENGGTGSNVAGSALYYEDLEICQYAPGEDGAIKSEYAAVRITGDIRITVRKSDDDPSGYEVTVDTNNNDINSTINVVTHQKSS